LAKKRNREDVFNMSQEEVFYVLVCYHCGNKTQMRQIAHFDRQETDNFLGFEKLYSITIFTDWDLYLCPVCDNVTLLKTTRYTKERDPQNGELIPSETILYPSVSLDESGIPEAVKKSFEAALRVKNVEGTVCAIAIRRTLEMMCKDKKASGKDLYHKLKDLSDKGVLPPIINEMASVLRELGNEAAHGDDREFSEELIDSMIKFTHAILDYVYNLPEKLSEIQTKLRKTVEGSASLQCSITVRSNGEVIEANGEDAR
jgi:signal recognition particle subunit SEC65